MEASLPATNDATGEVNHRTETGVELRPVAGYLGYFAGNDGNIYSYWTRRYGKKHIDLSKSPRALKGRPSRNGYLGITLCRDGERAERLVHLLISEAFHGPRPPGYECSHEDGDRTHNEPSNLLWETHADNLKRRLLHGTHDRGTKNSRALLTDEMLAAIDRRLVHVEAEVGPEPPEVAEARESRRRALNLYKAGAYGQEDVETTFLIFPEGMKRVKTVKRTE